MAQGGGIRDTRNGETRNSEHKVASWWAMGKVELPLDPNRRIKMKMRDTAIVFKPFLL